MPEAMDRVARRCGDGIMMRIDVIPEEDEEECIHDELSLEGWDGKKDGSFPEVLHMQCGDCGKMVLYDQR